MFELRAGGASDVDAMYQLDLLCFEPPFRFSLRTMRQLVAQKNSYSIVAEVEQTLAGFIVVEIECADEAMKGYVLTLDVHPEYRRKGLAKTLMAVAEKDLANAGADLIWLHVDQENEAAVRFYERAGYRRSGVAVAYYGSQRDAWIYERYLSKQGDQPT